MKNYYYLLAMIIVVASSCKKEAALQQEPPPKIQKKYADSIFFKIGGNSYQNSGMGSLVVSNGQTNLKPSGKEISGRNYAIATGGMFWYGDRDSTYYGIHHKFILNQGWAELVFTKKILTDALQKEHTTLKVYRDNEAFFKAGMRSFATDFEMEQSTDGVVLIADGLNQYPSILTSSRPGFSILRRPDIGNNIQKDSKFEIIKTEKLTDDIILIQAKFELNFYDQEGRKYSVTDGFFQKRIKRKADQWWQLAVN